jgi:hypothetical protein
VGNAWLPTTTPEDQKKIGSGPLRIEGRVVDGAPFVATLAYGGGTPSRVDQARLFPVVLGEGGTGHLHLGPLHCPRAAVHLLFSFSVLFFCFLFLETRIKIKAIFFLDLQTGLEV